MSRSIDELVKHNIFTYESYLVKIVIIYFFLIACKQEQPSTIKWRPEEERFHA